MKLRELSKDQPHNAHCDVCGRQHLNGNCKEFHSTTNEEPEEHASTKEEVGEDKKDEKEEGLEMEDHVVWREAQSSQFWKGVKIQQERTQQSMVPTNVSSSKEDRSEELDRYLDSFYALFIVLHIERVWKHLQLYFKFMMFLPQKRKKKDDVFFVSYQPP